MTEITDFNFAEDDFTAANLAKFELIKSEDEEDLNNLAELLNHIVAAKVAKLSQEKDEFYSKQLALKELESDTFYNNSPSGYFSTDGNGIINKINNTLLVWLGYAKEDIIGKVTWQSLLSVGNKMYFETHYSPLLQMQGFVQEISFEMVKKDRTRLPILINTKQIRDENGKVWINYSTVFDVSQRKSYEKELLIAKRTAEEQNKLINETNQKLLTSEEELIQNMEELASQRDHLNQTLEELKLSQNQMIRSEKFAVMGKLVASVAHEINTPLGAIQASASNMLVGLQKSLPEIPKLFQLLSVDEQILFFDLVAQALKNKSFLSSREERQARKKLEKDLQEIGLKEVHELTYKLSSIGFYDNLRAFLPLFRHPESLSIIQIAIHLINQQNGIRTIQTAINKASKVVFALKTYARHDHSNAKTKAKISDSLETVLTLYHGQMKHSVEILRSYGEMSEILCYFDELNQVWTNLIHNALQAMDNEGKLEIGANQEGKQIEVRIKDSGKGIPKAIQDRIFEPFFTTKPIGEGSGLGLDIVLKIIEKHEGQIWFETEEGVGTTFYVRLPIGE